MSYNIYFKGGDNYGAIRIARYGEPIYTKEGEILGKDKKAKEEGSVPQKKLWLWITILIFNLLILFIVGIEATNTLTLLALDSMTVFVISVVNLFINLFKQRKIKNDLIFIIFSVVTFFIFIVSLAP